MKKQIDKQIHADELKLRILITNACNQDCSFCLNDFQAKPSKAGRQFIDANVAKRAISQYAEFFQDKYPLQVYFSGGEPTLHPNLPGLMRYTKDLNCRVTLNTNGNFPDSLEKDLLEGADQIHFGTYKKSNLHAEKIKRMNGLIQCIYPYANESFVSFYVKKNIPIKVFRDFYDLTDESEYVSFAKRLTEKFPEANLSFRHTGIQENRGPGCEDCEKRCITLKAAWVFPDNGTSPCPQFLKHTEVYPKNNQEWKKYFADVEKYHKRIE